MTGVVRWRRAQSGRLRTLWHAVPERLSVDEYPTWPEWRRLSQRALCGFAPQRSWSDLEPRFIDERCARCAARLEPKENQ